MGLAPYIPVQTARAELSEMNLFGEPLSLRKVGLSMQRGMQDRM